MKPIRERYTYINSNTIIDDQVQAVYIYLQVRADVDSFPNSDALATELKRLNQEKEEMEKDQGCIIHELELKNKDLAELVELLASVQDKHFKRSVKLETENQRVRLIAVENEHHLKAAIEMKNF